jgi:hypothetical protein
MTKRFTINGKEIIQDKQVWCMANSEHCADVIATAMNELYEENEQLRKDSTVLILANQDYMKENEKLKKEVEDLKQALIRSAFK